MCPNYSGVQIYALPVFMHPIPNLRFARKQQDFFTLLNQRVSGYFKDNNISRHANTEMVFKTLFMFTLYALPYGTLIAGVPTSWAGVLALYLLMGIGLAGIGLSVMHDANHGSYSRKKWVNTLLGYSLNLIGGHAITWKIQLAATR